MTDDPVTVWTIIVLLGLGTFLIRFSFLGIIGDRKLPAWILRHLRYTPVAVLPGLVAPLVIWPAATGGQPDLPRISAAVAALATGYLTKSFLAAFATGAVTLYALLYLTG
ncbi:AzlD domain-containing protein [Psychromarinibacter sp. C21-152]|uniref:AzlD domain-containing protein n=1 Tax=Psychromarinibacter sediminicola TaxID=3033385 RepID=A0AAE3NUV2_9RHOB|nr:AzlD domain-containing protein [Psychromarinibacter sediminicola]MDF0601037.1 AzlD domain-containing protein [Psychromarinibacter sediminicola]